MVNPQQYGHLLHDTFFALSHTILFHSSPKPAAFTPKTAAEDLTPKTAAEFGERDGVPGKPVGGGRAERGGGGGLALDRDVVLNPKP